MEDLFPKKQRGEIRPAKRIKPQFDDEISSFDTITIDELNFKKVNFESNKLKSSFSNELKKTDLIPDVYEGGFKLWECCIDMIQFLRSEKIQFANSKVIDLGCGHAFPGIYALQNGAHVDFQDYNEEVIELITVPNVILNCREGIDRAEFYSGDWSLLENTIEKKYDFILTTDTLYSFDNHEILASFITNRLSDNGICYVAAKSYYFGVGGSTQTFLNVIEEQNKLEAQVLKKIVNGKSNVREIISLKKRL